MPDSFTPLSSFAGGALIGLAATLLLWINGRIAGISSVVSGIVRPATGDVAWRVVFLGGLAGAGAAAAWLFPGAIGESPSNTGTLALAGLLVGSGTRLANGCTSGHGVCGVSRWSLRSIVATATFCVAGVLVASLVRFGGAP
jgi:uncharacterized membrane protein YedE/YeeE